jgi:hypothetical protein
VSIAALRERPSTATRLRAALLELAGDKAQLLEHSEKAWASVTFSGARHTLRLRFNDIPAIEAGEQLIATLADHSITIPRAHVVEAAITHVSHHVAIDPPHLEVIAQLLVLDKD